MLADLHVHTKYSHCSAIEPSVLLKKTRFLSAIAVTDHNTFKGYDAVRRLNKNRDFEIIKSCEYATSDGDIIGYYVNEDIPANLSAAEVCDRIHEQGGLTCAPHPLDFFRDSAIGSKTLKEIVRKVDIIEGLNGREFFFFNLRAAAFAKRHKKPAIASSDAHYHAEIGRVFTEFNGKITKPTGYFDGRVPGQWLLFGLSSKIRRKFF
jgi:hypothetical protein